MLKAQDGPSVYSSYLESHSSWADPGTSWNSDKATIKLKNKNCLKKYFVHFLFIFNCNCVWTYIWVDGIDCFKACLHLYDFILRVCLCILFINCLKMNTLSQNPGSIPSHKQFILKVLILICDLSAKCSNSF